MPHVKNNNSEDTSWHEVASWYDDLLRGEDTYQSKVIAPHLLRLMNISRGEKVLDVACGQGFFSSLFHKAGAEVIGIDLGVDLIALAKKNTPDITYHTASADFMTMVKDKSIDKAVIVLALQNIKTVRETFAEIRRVLKSGGELFIVLNHPSFRIPQVSSWGFEGDKQYRRIDAYMSEREVYIDMHPGDTKKVQTVSFHRPLQWYVKHAVKSGFVLTGLEEWISHKESQKGPHKTEEDRIRKEIPLFMCLVFKVS